MEKKYDAYLYGMVLVTNSFLLSGDFPQPDTYAEISKSYSLPGGETGTCATVLSSLGCSVKMDGNHLGKNTYGKLKEFYSNKDVDMSSMLYDEEYDGLQDYVIIDKNTRTPMGMFGHFYADSNKRWSRPDYGDIVAAKVVGLDDFFGDCSREVAEICRENGIKYVTIDTPYDGYVCKNAEIVVLSTEFFGYHYPEADREELFKKYIENTDALVIFTHGSKEIKYGRRSTGVFTAVPYKVETISTLGAGDTFKAGCVYALLKGMTDKETVMFASAAAAVACSVFPLPLHPPKLEQIVNLQQTNG